MPHDEGFQSQIFEIEINRRCKKNIFTEETPQNFLINEVK